MKLGSTRDFVRTFIDGKLRACKFEEATVPDRTVERLKLAWETSKAVDLSDPARKRVDEILEEWIEINKMVIALGIHLTKRDYREFMLHKLGVK